ncbi:molybdopterin-guanine dinucleotide biosynthesis protein B [Aquitalea denitrificans]|uniref:molybdopterin-guanine dinucleotide biosynthesis protein B n=1 Tax=Aquitalea denitrificans TaxID=519081 RepID=UPI00135A4FBA|nr:molybdopterin-guanine dinucleotide biosynthesis protein B [Aquitalea denitrificans]
MYVLGVAGYSGSGKTTLLEKVIPLLCAAGVDVAVIKHTHHDVDWDQPGKDSWRHREAGARQVLLAGARRRLLVETMPQGNDAPLATHVAALRPCDLVLAEGFKHESHPRLEVYDPALGHAPLCLHDPAVLALISDADVPVDLPRFRRDDADGVARFILALLETQHDAHR